jgi:serine/threonine protein kinase
VVAVKVISHTDVEEERIQREVQLHLSFDHPNVVRALHYAKVNLGASEHGSDKVRRGSVMDRPGALSAAGSGAWVLPQRLGSCMCRCGWQAAGRQ